MKNLFLNKISSRRSVLFWAAFHLAIFFALAICFLCGRRYSINTNLFDILPDSSAMKSVGNADRALSGKTGRQFFILAEAEDFNDAKRTAQMLCDELMPDNLLFENVSLGASEDDLNEIIQFYYKNRFLLLNKDFIATLNSSGGAEEIAEAALEKAYSGFSMMPLEYIATDPFFLTEFAMENLIANLSNSGTSMSLNDGVLSAEYEGKHYVMLRGTLTPLGSSITNKKSGVKKIYECAQKVQSQNPEVEFIYSGVPFHSYKSSSGAQKEIAIITMISVIAIILLFLFIFRTVLPILCSVGAITLSAVTAFCATLLAFGQIHILCFVFGTTLIGTCLDYSVHFFIRWKNACDNGIAIRKKLFRGLLLSCASTELCYLILLFAPFMLLKQIAIFCSAGILSSFLTVILVYPNIAMPKKKNIISTEAEKSALSQEKNCHTDLFRANALHFLKVRNVSCEQIPSGLPSGNYLNRRLHDLGISVAIPILLIATISLIAIGFRKNLRIENDIRSFYTMSGKILDDEILATKVLNHGSSGWYFIVRGLSQEELLANEEKFCDKLNEEIANGKLTSYTACTQFLPSPLSQVQSWKACSKLISQDFIQGQLLDLGYSEDEIQVAINQIHSEYNACDKNFVQSETLPAFAKNALSSLWIGQVQGEWFSAVMPLHAKDVEVFKTLCDQDANVFFVNKVSDIGFELNRLTRIMLVLLAVAFAILILSLNFFYPIKTVLKIAIVPLAIMLAETAALAAFNIPIGFFSVTAIILVFGLGLDYIIYTVESGDKLNRLAILISFLTTEFSFGAIAFSTFVPVKVFGIVVAAGLLAAFVCQMLIGNSTLPNSEKNI